MITTSLKKGSALDQIDLQGNALERLPENVCALLNSDGGRIACELPGADVQSVARKWEAKLKDAITPTALFALDPDSEPGFLIVDVPAGQDGPYLCEGAVWLRRDQKTVPATAATLRELILEQAGVLERWERRLSTGMTFEDLDLSEIQALVADAVGAQRLDVRNRDPDAVLYQLGLRRSDGFTQGCDVLFSSRPAVRFPQSRAQYMRFESDKLGDRYSHIESIEGPAARVFDDVLRYLRPEVSGSHYFSPDSSRREARPAYALEALREGLVNAFVHRDYAAYSGGIKVSVYPTKIEIWNSGRLPDGITPADLRRDHLSVPVNPDIMHVFYLRGLAERAGRGTAKIIAACKAIGAPAPVWKEVSGGVQLTLYSEMPAPAFVAREELNARQRQFLNEVAVEEVIAFRDYALRFASGVSRRQASRDLVELERLGIIRQESGGRTSSYRRVSE